MPAKTQPTSVDFEQALSKLEALVGKMEAGDLSLEQSLEAFEEGVKLTRECQTQLAQAEQRVKKLMEENGRVTTVDFQEDGAE
ncbi:exodeoxyribonuclease VII small subunit [Gilvimarinus sp. F26214L]|uniref:exodeoxyribonuclease VII small subunit n=1 Tax=Gilvimarinus sp. DZF01 TaxID=3461371 RepID=UPI0040454285